MDSAQAGTKPVIFDIGSPTSEVSRLSIALVLSITLVFLATSAFMIGFFIGRSSLNSQPVIEKQTPNTKTSGDKTTYTDQANHYSITFPNSWSAKAKQGIAGVLVNSQSARVELWLVVRQEVGFSSQQKAGIDKTSSYAIDIGNEKAKVTEYLYKAGNYFATVELPSTHKTPLVTFWIKAEDSPSFQTSKTIVSSFTFI